MRSASILKERVSLIHREPIQVPPFLFFFNVKKAIVRHSLPQ